MREAFELGLSDLCGTDELESAAAGAVAIEGEESSWTVVIVRYNEQRTVSMMMMEGIEPNPNLPFIALLLYSRLPVWRSSFFAFTSMFNPTYQCRGSINSIFITAGT